MTKKQGHAYGVVLSAKLLNASVASDAHIVSTPYRIGKDGMDTGSAPNMTVLNVDTHVTCLCSFRPTSLTVMVKLIVKSAANDAIDEYCAQKRSQEPTVDDAEEARLQRLSGLEIGKPIEHHDLIDISRFLTQRGNGPGARRYRLDVLLKGALVYQPPPPPKPEPVRFAI